MPTSAALRENPASANATVSSFAVLNPATHISLTSVPPAFVNQNRSEYSILFDTVLRDKLVLLSVSPVRHIKDGLEENNLSKSTLLLAAAELAAKYENVNYFPAFEIVNDELRDYRFYKEDMVHPSDQAVEYVWDIFGEALFTKKTAETVEEVRHIVMAAAHRPFNPESASYRRFLRSMLRKAEALQKKHPTIDLSREIEYFGS